MLVMDPTAPIAERYQEAMRLYDLHKDVPLAQRKDFTLGKLADTFHLKKSQLQQRIVGLILPDAIMGAPKKINAVQFEHFKQVIRDAAPKNAISITSARSILGAYAEEAGHPFKYGTPVGSLQHILDPLGIGTANGRLTR